MPEPDDGKSERHAQYLRNISTHRVTFSQNNLSKTLEELYRRDIQDPVRNAKLSAYNEGKVTFSDWKRFYRIRSQILRRPLSFRHQTPGPRTTHVPLRWRRHTVPG